MSTASERSVMMGADELRKAADDLREFWPTSPIEPLLAGPIGEWLENIAAWLDEGGLSEPGTNLPDAWADTLDYASDVARLINGGAE